MTVFSDSVDELTAAGRRDDILRVLDAAAKAAQADYRAIREDPDLSDAGRRKLLAQRTIAYRDAVDQDLAKIARETAAADQRDAGRVFGTAGLPGDPASLSISRRDAQTRVAAVKDGAELARLLTSATRSGDEVLARAIVQRAVDGQYVSIVNQYMAAHPQTADSVERLWTRAQRAAHTDRGGDFGVTLKLSAVMPAEFHTRRDAELHAAAAS